MFKNKQQPLALFLALAVLISCAKERDVKPVLANSKRVPASQFQGTFLFLKSFPQVKYDDGRYGRLVPGSYETQDVLVEFVRKEKSLDVVAVNPLYQSYKPALTNNVLASFTIKNVDVLRKQNADGEDTNEEEETETRRPWNEREFIELDGASDALNGLKGVTEVATPSAVEADAAGALNFTVDRQLKSGTQVSERYSFLKFEHNPSYQQREYANDLQTKFGFFKTVAYQFDRYGRITQSNTKEFINRWDTSKPIVYYLSKGFPERLKPLAKEVVAGWNEAFQAAIGKSPVELRDNSGQEAGDLRYSMIVYDDTVAPPHGVLGFGPSYTNPRTGQIVKADVILFGGVLSSSIYRERIWESLLREPEHEPLTQAELDQILEAFKQAHEKPAGEKPKRVSPTFTLAQMKTWSEASTTSAGQLEAPTWTALFKQEKLIDTQKRMREEATSDKARTYMTFFGEATAGAVNSAVALNKLSDEQVEAIIFRPLLTHEMGHNLGLRHNFMASADEKHFEGHSKYSSVMDYGFLSSEETSAPGSYDKAALRVAYNDDPSVIAQESVQNYYYCTDEHTDSSENAMCNRFDSGPSLQEVVKNQVKRYEASYQLNNQRLDRAYFGYPGETGEYVNKVRSMLVPLRDMYDYAHAILQASSPTVLKQSPSLLWKLARQRVEADPGSDPKNVVTLRVLSGTTTEFKNGRPTPVPIMVERKIDLAKIKGLREDANKAKMEAFSGLVRTVFDQDRPLFSTVDPVNGNLQIRGTIYDKLLAMSALISKTMSPLNPGSFTSVAETLPFPGVEDMLRTMISKISYVPNPENAGELIPQNVEVDINLRSIALDLLVNELAVPGGSAHTRKLIAIERLPLNEQSPEWKLSQKHAVALKNLFKEIYRKPDMEEARAKDLMGKLNTLMESRNGEEQVVFHTPFTASFYYRAPRTIPNLDMQTATGDLIRWSLNNVSVMQAAIAEVAEEKEAFLKTESEKPEKERDSKAMIEATQLLPQLQATSQNLGERIEQEETLLDQVARMYEPR